MIKTRRFKIEAGELKYLRNGHMPVCWGSVILHGSTHAYIPEPITCDDDMMGCGIMTADTCEEIAGLLKQLDQAPMAKEQ